jgi:membrane protease YdiL (CAAX protease family)
MLPDKPWKLEAIVRLLLSVLACAFAGSLLATGLYVTSHHLEIRWKFFLISSVAFASLGIAISLLRKQWSWNGFLPRAIISLVFLYAGFSLGVWAETVTGPHSDSISTGQMIVSLLGFQAAALWLVHRFIKESGSNWKDTFGFAKRWETALLWGLAAGVIYFFLGNGLQKLSAEAMKHLPISIESKEQQAVQTIRMASAWRDRLVLGLGTIALAPFAEEILFRGILYPAIKRAGFPRLALWLTSFLFAAIHLNLATFIPLLALALLLTFLYEYTGNLLASIAAHALFNALNFLQI